MRKSIILSLTTSAIIIGGSFVSGAAFAQTETTPVMTPPVAVVAPVTKAVDADHKRIKEVEKRIDKQEEKIVVDEKAGKLTTEQATKDEERLKKEGEQLKKDESEHGGNITKGEQKQLNHELNKNLKIEKKQKQHNRVEKKEHKEEVKPVDGAVTTAPATTTPVTK